MILIDKDELLEKAKKTDAYFVVKGALTGISTIDAVEIVHGEWKQARGKEGYAMGCNCSVCGRKIRNQSTWHPDNYCPKCGAKMDALKQEAPQ